MTKLIFCDQNKKLVDLIKPIFEELSEYNPWGLTLEAVHGDVFECQKANKGFRICTASNPDFTFGGGLDAEIAKRFPEEIGRAKEFALSDNLFYLITVDESIRSTKSIIQRCFVGVLAHRHQNLIITGVGTGIGGLDETEFANLIRAILKDADLRGANLIGADLRGAILIGANLIGADLRGAILIGADLRGADLRNANLRGAILRDADLRDANLRNADLKDADLRNADLRDADLRNANLIRAILKDADLRNADLRDADLRGANLRGAILRDADLRGAILRDADLRDAILRDADHSEETQWPYFFVCPEAGNFVAWKKTNSGVVCKLEIRGKRTSCLINRKCRTDKAKVLGFYNFDKTLSEKTTDVSRHDNNFVYEVGKIVRAKDYDDNFLVDCTEGIHFFVTFDEAKDY